MRKFLLSAAVLTGIAAASQFAGAGTAEARPLATVPVASAEAGLIQPVQYYHNRYDRYERHRYYRWRRHQEWRARHGYYRHHY